MITPRTNEHEKRQYNCNLKNYTQGRKKRDKIWKEIKMLIIWGREQIFVFLFYYFPIFLNISQLNIIRIFLKDKFLLRGQSQMVVFSKRMLWMHVCQWSGKLKEIAPPLLRQDLNDKLQKEQGLAFSLYSCLDFKFTVGSSVL